MMYSEAEFLFNTALFEDPECAVALWGKSMTITHPLWPGGPSNEDLEPGLALVKQASGYENTTAREKAYIGTTFAYFNTNTKAQRIDRLVNFEGA